MLNLECTLTVIYSVVFTVLTKSYDILLIGVLTTTYYVTYELITILLRSSSDPPNKVGMDCFPKDISTY